MLHLLGSEAWHPFTLGQPAFVGSLLCSRYIWPLLQKSSQSEQCRVVGAKVTVSSDTDLSLHRIFRWQTRIVYVESIARVNSLSLSGKILYHFRIADAFFVQWPHLQHKFPRSMCCGSLF